MKAARDILLNPILSILLCVADGSIALSMRILSVVVPVPVGEPRRKVLRLGVPLVSAAHVIRMIVLVIGSGPMFGLARAVAEGFRRRY